VTSFLKRKVVMPVVTLLKAGATPETLAWSLAMGMVVGVNPLLGSTTVLALALAGVFKLNVAASQLGNHLLYPVELLLFPVWIKLGTILFRTEGLPMEPKVLFAEAKRHPWDTTQALWRWEWHGLVVWAAAACVLTPLIAAALRPGLRRALRHLQRGEAVVS